MRILIVEDEVKIANALKKGLEQESYAADVALDGEEGLALASSEEYDLLIVDIMLPKLDGVELTKQLREQKNSTPILFLTAKGQLTDKVSGLDAGADDYLVKPFSFEELLARVRALLRRPPKLLKNTLQIEDVTLDTTSFEVTRGETQIHLTQREYALLEYLMRHPNRILTKQQIINHVWDYTADVLPNTVEVYIGYLRNKIDKPFPDTPKLIQTVRGFGYKIGLK